MSNAVVTINGVIRADGSLDVQDKVHLAPGPVRVTVQPARDSAHQPSLIDVLAGFAREQAASPLPPRTREQIDAELNAMRDQAEEEMQAIERLYEESRRSKQA